MLKLITDKSLMNRVNKAGVTGFCDMARILGRDTIFEAMMHMLENGLSPDDIAEKFEIDRASMNIVMGRIRFKPKKQPAMTREELAAKIRETKVEIYGLRLNDGTRLVDHCAALGLKPRSAGYQAERRRLAREGKLMTAEEYRRAQSFRLHS